MKTKLLLVLAILSFNFSFSQTNVNVSSGLLPDTEPFIAVNPANPNNLIAAWMHVNLSGKVSIYSKNSTNGGMTWGNQHIFPHVSSNFTAADVSIAFNSAGNAFISFVDYKMALDSGYDRCAKSLDGGVTWSNPVNVCSGMDAPDLPVDRPWIVCDNSSTSLYAGRLYVVSKSYFSSAPPQKIWLSISSDSGNTWTPIRELDDSIPIDLLTNIMGTPTVGADGALYVAYMSWHLASNGGVPQVVSTKSTDGGITFTPYHVSSFTGSSAMNDSLYQGSYSLSANPAVAGNIIFQVTDNRNGDPDILELNSQNGGINWSTIPVRVNDDLPIGNGKGQDMSWSGFSPNGTYAVAWRDRRNSGNTDTAQTEIFTALSTDKGLTFSANYNLSSAPSPYINIQRGNDFIGVCLNNNYVFADWCDFRNANNLEIYSDYELQVQILPVAEISQAKTIVQLFPNPFSSSTTIHIDDASSSEWNFQVYDNLGKLVFEKMIYSQDEMLDLNLSSGIYFYKVRNEKEIISSGKLAVQ